MRLLELTRILKDVRPTSVLELGGGTTTPVFAHHAPRGGPPSITSMEEEERWENITRSLLPEELRPRVEFRSRPRIIEEWDGRRVARYDLEYDREYDLVYVDGPSGIDPTDRTPRHKLPLVDAVCLIRAGFLPRTIVVDSKRHSIEFFRAWGIEKFYSMKLGAEHRSPLGKILRPYRYHTVFDRR